MVNTYSIRNELRPEESERLSAYPELMRKLLFYRGVDSAEKAHTYLNPDYIRDLHDPFLLKDMDRAVERILQAVDRKEKILIYSDYDADGIPAAVALRDYFKLIHYENVHVYILHRHTEGYGLHLEAVDGFKENGVTLMITLDCGIVDHAEVAHANSLGIDVIITDHHVPAETLPAAHAVLNAKRHDCDYPFDMLCGAGVAFKLVQALLEKRRYDISAGQEKWLLDMVGLATLSDMVPLQGENRVLAQYGLKVLRKSRRPGLRALLNIINVDQRYITEDDVGFMITPRVNAASRMGIPADAFSLLSTDDTAEGERLARHLDAINSERKGLVASTVKEIKRHLAERAEHFAERSVIVLGNPLWRPALLGLAANTIAEEYGKPVFLWGREEGVDIKGSCRAGGSMHLVKLMNGVRDHFLEFGGHAFSGGFAVRAEKIHTLEDALHAAAQVLESAPQVLEPKYLDAELSLDDVTNSTYAMLEKLAPFGMDNPKPLFLFNNVTPVGVRMFGKAKDHLELVFSNAKGRRVKAIGFFMTSEDFEPAPKIGIPLNLVAFIEKSYFGAAPEIRLRIVDIL